MSKYSSCIDIVYKRFDNNVGGTDLVGQWNRCINMNQGEPWLWLFSDDDIMSENCVEDFYRYIKKTPEARLVHYNIAVIDNMRNIIQETCYPHYLSTKAYIDGKLKGELISMVVEFVFQRDLFYKTGGFENYDLAWGSDFVSWIKFSNISNGIFTCPNSLVYWRYSGENISSDKNDKVIFRKLNSVVRYTSWILNFSILKGYGHPFFYSKYAIGETIRNRKHLSSKQIIYLILQLNQAVQGERWHIFIDFIKTKVFKYFL